MSESLRAEPVKAFRYEEIDVARGGAMLLVFLAHFLAEIMVQVPAAEHEPVIHLLDLLTYAAAPAFVLISGFTQAMVLARTDRSKLAARKSEILNRAAFMLVVGHLLLSVTEILLSHTPRPWAQLFITDAIAGCLMLGLLVLPDWSPRRLAGLAIVSYVVGWWLHLNVVLPGRGVASLALDALFSLDSGPLRFGYPLLQWFSWFLVGAILGRSFAQLDSPGARSTWGRWLTAGAAVVIAFAVLVRLALKFPPMSGWLSPGLQEMIMLGARTPPGPIQLGVFGGLGILLTGLAIELPVARTAVGRAIAVIGRASLFVFFLQSLVFRDIVARLPLTARWTWPVVFVISVMVIWLAARSWDAIGGNRWFRLGLVPRPQARVGAH
jgi:uncharacterized membrane protein